MSVSLKRQRRKVARLPMAKFADDHILDRLDDLEAPPMVKIYMKIIRRKYKRRYPYAYPKYLVPVSANYDKLILQLFREIFGGKIRLGQNDALNVHPTKGRGTAEWQ